MTLSILADAKSRVMSCTADRVITPATVDVPSPRVIPPPEVTDSFCGAEMASMATSDLLVMVPSRATPTPASFTPPLDAFTDSAPALTRLLALTLAPSTVKSRLVTIRPSSMLAVAAIRVSRPIVIVEIAVGSNRVEVTPGASVMNGPAPLPKGSPPPLPPPPLPPPPLPPTLQVSDPTSQVSIGFSSMNILAGSLNSSDGRSHGRAKTCPTLRICRSREAVARLR